MATANRQDSFPNAGPLIRKAPWPGIVAIGGMAVCLIASTIVIGTSHDNHVSSWTAAQPAVLIAIFSAASNIVFNTALATGIAVRFWLCASRGVKLSQLHYIWDHGRVLGIGSAMRAGPPARTVAVLALLANLMQFVGPPLLQRASYLALESQHMHETMSLDVARTIPDGWLGFRDGRGAVVNLDRTYPLIQQWWHNTTIPTGTDSNSICNGTCSAFVAGAGFAYKCWTTAQSLELATPKTNNQTVFLINVATIQNETNKTPYLRLTTWHVADITNDCVGTLHKETCDLVSATIEYPVTIQNRSVHLRREELTQNRHSPSVRVFSSYTSLGDSPVSIPISSDLDSGAPTGIGPLTAMYAFLNIRITDNATKTFLEAPTEMSYYTGPGIMADIFYVADGDDRTGPKSKCRLTWTSPTEYVLGTLYEFLFRAAVQLGRETGTMQTFEAQQTTATLVFRTDWRYLGAGMTVTACGLVLVAVLMWGWWRLERPVTLSPLETASAMGAPILCQEEAAAERDATIGEILARVKHVEFRLGTPRVQTLEIGMGKEG